MDSGIFFLGEYYDFYEANRGKLTVIEVRNFGRLRRKDDKIRYCICFLFDSDYLFCWWKLNLFICETWRDFLVHQERDTS